MSKYKYNDWSGPLVKFDEWCEKVYESTKKTFGLDADQDCPVDIIFIDRTKYQPMHWWQIPYEHKAKTEKDFDDIERALMNNLDIAMSAYKIFLSLKQHRQSKKKK